MQYFVNIYDVNRSEYNKWRLESKHNGQHYFNGKLSYEKRF